MSSSVADGLHPDDFAEAAAAAIEDAAGRPRRAVARLLAQAGLTGVAATEADGGLGLDIAFAVPVAEAAGRQQLRFPLVDQIVLARALAGTSQAGAIVCGERVASIAWQGSLAEGLAGHALHAAGPEPEVEADWLLVADGAGAVLLDLDGLANDRDTALDPASPRVWWQLAGAKVVARLEESVCRRLQQEAMILLAAFVTGAADGAIARSQAHVSTRVQFGRPLSSKQAVRHWMARMKLLTEASAAATRRVLQPDEFGQVRDPAPTLASAVAHATFVLEKAIHLHGGMGFTWEVPLHWSLRDIRAIEAAVGGSAFTRRIGERFIEAVDERFVQATSVDAGHPETHR